MARKSKEERRASLRRRTQKSVEERDSKGGGKTVINMSKATNTKKKATWYKVKSGAKRNELSILPYEVTQDYYKKMKTFSGAKTGAESGDLDYKLEIAVHYSVGPDNENVICLREMFGKHCEICQARFDEMDKGDDQDEKTVANLKARWRVYYNVYDEKDPDAYVQLWEASYHLFEKLLLEDIEEDTEDGGEPLLFADLEDGVVIKFKGKEKKLGKNKFVEAQSFEYKDRQPFDDDILDDVFPLDKMLIIPTEEQVTKLFLGLETDDEDEKKEEPETRGRGRGRGRGRNDSDTSEKDAEPRGPGRGRRRPVDNKKTKEKKEEKEDLPSEPDKKDEGDNKCPYGGKFGYDCNKLSECDNACPDDTFNECCDLADEAAKAKKIAEENAKKSGSGRRRRR